MVGLSCHVLGKSYQGCYFFDIIYRLWVVSCRLSVVSCRLSVVGYRLSVVGLVGTAYSVLGIGGPWMVDCLLFSVVCCRLVGTAYSVPGIGRWWTVEGSLFSVLGFCWLALWGLFFDTVILLCCYTAISLIFDRRVLTHTYAQARDTFTLAMAKRSHSRLKKWIKPYLA